MIDLPAVTDCDVSISRRFAAPRATVWKFWTSPEHLAEWFGPTGMHTPVEAIEVDVREGGSWNLGMTDDTSGEVCPRSETITKAIEPEYLEMIVSAQSSSGDLEEIVLRIQFHDHGDSTRMNLHQGPFTPEVRDLAADGWNQSFARLNSIFEGAQA